MQLIWIFREDFATNTNHIRLENELFVLNHHYLCIKCIACVNIGYSSVLQIKHWKNDAGGASGIGLETARVLALRKVHVIIAVRNMVSAKEAKQQILEENESARVDVMKLDLCSVNSITSFVDNFIALDLPLNILMFVFSFNYSQTYTFSINTICEVFLKNIKS